MNRRGPKSNTREPSGSRSQSGTIRSSSSARLMPRALAIASMHSAARVLSPLNLSLVAIPLICMSAVSLPIVRSTSSPSTAR